MANDPLSPVIRGEVLAVRADTWNAVLDATRRVLQPQRPDQPATARTRTGVVVARGLNATGADLREGRPVALTGIGGYDLADDYAAAHWAREPILALGVPASASDRVAVTLEAIPDGGIGSVALAGVVECMVNMGTADTARFARPSVGTTDYLDRALRGPIEVIAVADGEGSTRRAVVLLGGCCDAGPAPLDQGCLTVTKNGLGYVTDVSQSQRWVLGDGTVECRTATECGDDCATSPLPAPPSPPPPVPPYVPPDPEPETYDVWVQIDECPGADSESPYTVVVDGATDTAETQTIAAGAGKWFLGVPWGTDTNAVLTYGGTSFVGWNTVSMGCGGTSGSGYSLSAPVNGTSCDNIAVAFTVGVDTCGLTPAPGDTEDVDAKPIEE